MMTWGESIEEWEARSKRAAGRQSDNHMVKLTNQISLVLSTLASKPLVLQAHIMPVEKGSSIVKLSLPSVSLGSRKGSNRVPG
jgi:hypothetical protein